MNLERCRLREYGLLTIVTSVLQLHITEDESAYSTWKIKVLGYYFSQHTFTGLVGYTQHREIALYCVLKLLSHSIII